MAVSPETLLGGTLAFSITAYLVGMALQLYSIFLNHRQAKVKGDSEQMVELLRSIDTKMSLHNINAPNAPSPVVDACASCGHPRSFHDDGTGRCKPLSKRDFMTGSFAIGACACTEFTFTQTI